MSKSLNTYLLPGLGIATLAMGLGFGMANRNYGDEKIRTLEARLGQVEAHASASSAAITAESAKKTELEGQVTELLAALDARSGSFIEPAPRLEGTLGLGRPAHPDEIAAWDVDVLPDGRGLPEGRGDVVTGEAVFVEKCGSCHGDFAEGVDNWPVLAGGFNTLADEDPVKTVGSYWPFLSTAWDYVHRSMPFGEAGTLSADETYAIVAYILYSNDVVDEEFELSQDNFAEVAMYNADGFVVDDRPALEYAQWRMEPCMQNCKERVGVTMRTVFLLETPVAGGSNSVMNPARNAELPSFTADGPSFVPTVEIKPQQDAALIPAASDDGVADADLIAAGEKVFRKCKACHEIGEGATNKTGPQLNGIMGRVFGSVDGFRYSKAFKAANEEGRTWDASEMAAFLAKPKSYIKGTKMSFAGLKKEGDQIAIIAYLSSFLGD